MPKTIITKETYEIAKKEIKKLKNEGTIFKKLLSVKLAYENNIKQTAEFLNIYPVSIKNWAKLINEKGSGRGLISICAAGGQGVTAIIEK